MSEPSWDSTTPIAAPVTAQVPASEPTWEGTQDIQDVAGTPAQTALGIGERALQGLISRPGAAYLEKTLSEYGVPGLSPKEQALREEASPWLGGAAEAVGLIAPTVLTGGEAPLYTQAGLLDKIGKGATAVTGLGGKGASLGSRILGKGIAGAAENAAFAAGDVGSQIINGKSPSDAIETAIPYVTLASVIGGAGGLVFGGVPELWSASGAPEKVAQLMNTIKPASALAPEEGDLTLRPYIKKMVTTFLGVPEHQLDSYLAHSAEINAAPEFEEIYSHAYNHISNINEQLEAKQITAAQAEKAYNDYANDLKSAFKQQGFEAKVGDSVAKNALKQAQNNLALSIQGRALNTSKPIFEALQGLRSKVVDGSENAFNILEQQEQPIPLNSFYDKISELQNELNKGATIESREMAERLGQYAEGVKKTYGDSVPAPNAKLMIQTLDKNGKWNYNASTFDNGLTKYYNQIRHTLDATVKDSVPKYRVAMEPVANDTSLLRSLEDYGTPEDTTSRIKSLNNPVRYKNEMPMLRQLQESSSTPFINDLENYANPEIRSKLMKALPEYGEAQKTAALLSELKNPKTQAAINEELSKSAEAQAMKTAQEELANAKQARNEIKGLTSATIEGRLKTVMRGRSIEGRKILSQLPELNGKTIPEILDLVNVRNAFEKANMNGSRNVNLFGGLLGGVSGLTGNSGLFGFGAGAVAGGMADKYGPSFAKKMLDKYIEHFGELAKPGEGVNRSAIKSGLYRMLSGNAPNNPAGFKSMVDHYSNVLRGENLVSSAAKNVFSTGSKVIPASFYPDEKSREKLKKSIEASYNGPEHLAKGGMVGHYLPDHQTAIGALQANAVNYLRSIKPNQVQASPLDKPMPIDKYKEAAYNRQLDIADQPLLTLQHAKEGTLQPQDVQTLNTLYPNLHGNIVKKTFEEMSNALKDGAEIPFRQRKSLSLLMGKPLDSSMTQPAMLSIAMNNVQTGQPSGPNKISKESGAQMEKINSLYQTPQQAAEAKRTEE